MSRIAGIFIVLPDDRRRAAVEAMLSAYRPGSVRYVATTGPAGFGWCGWRSPNIATAGGVTVVMDGAIFNRRELGAKAEGRDNDAGRFIALYRRHGFDEAMRRINGDLSVALFDAESSRLYLGRDRFGLKPMYYADRAHLFAFASQPRALFALSGIEAQPDPRFVALFAGAHYRAFDDAAERSPYLGISQLPAGHVLEFRAGDSKTRRYWRLEEHEEFGQQEDELADRYRALLLDSVRLRFAAAERPAFTLSGGLDSSSVLSCAFEIGGTPLHAFSSGYTDATFDESDDIRPMVAAKVAEWHRVAIGDDVDVFGLVGRMIEAHDEPVATATWLSHYLICEQAAAGGFKALFGGLGGDELNAGEYEYFPLHFADLRADGDEEAVAHEVACWVRHHDHPIHRKSADVADALIEKLADPRERGRCLPDLARLRRYAHAVNPDLFDLASFEPVMDHPFSSYLKNRTYQDLFRETAPCCLRAEDRQTTAFGLDRFDPFLDHRLAEFMFRVPGRMKIRDGVTKRLLREAMRGILPEETRTRIAKTGWNAPAHVWFAGRNLESLRDMVRSRAFRERGLYDLEAVRRIVDEHVEIVSSGAVRENHMMFLWQLVNLETWLDTLAVTQAADTAETTVSRIEHV